MSDKNIINLDNRYGDKVYLEQKETKEWILKGELSPLRVIFDKDPKIPRAVDPSGGPFLSVGSKVEGKKITYIKHTPEGYTFTLEDEDKED